MPGIGGRADKPSGHHLITIYEAVNATLQEILIGTTNQLLNALERRNLETPPSYIGHWQREHKISYRSVEYSIPLDDARAFIDSYAASISKSGWKIIKNYDPA